MTPRPATEEELEVVERVLRATGPRPCARLALELGWPSERVSLALLELWHRDRARVSTTEPYEWRLIA